MSTDNSSRTLRIPRRRRGTAAILTALIILLAAAFVAAQAILLQLGRPTWLIDSTQIGHRLAATPFNDRAVLITAAVAVVVGLWLLILAVLPPRRALTELREADPLLATGITRSGLRRALAGSAVTIDGITAARVRIHGSTAAATLHTPLRRTDGLAQNATDTLNEKLAALNPARPLAVKTRLDRKEN